MSKDNGGYGSGSSMCGDDDATDAQVYSSVVTKQPESSANSGAPRPLEPSRESRTPDIQVSNNNDQNNQINQRQKDQQISLEAQQRAREQHLRQVPPSWLPSSFDANSRKPKHPVRTDMAIVYSCLAGYVSVRNETAGSWLGVALAYFIMTHAHERDLIRILNLVTSDLISRESSHGYIQSIELKLLGWSKNLYFNPGKYQQ